MTIAVQPVLRALRERLALTRYVDRPRLSRELDRLFARKSHVTQQYLRIKAGPQRDRYVHQLVAEALLGRPLASNEEVDHLDGNTLNNEFTNLRVSPSSSTRS